MNFQNIKRLVIAAFALALVTTFSPVYGAVGQGDDYFKACMEIESNLDDVLRKEVCKQAADFIVKQQISADVDAILKEWQTRCVNSGEDWQDCEAEDWLRAVVAQDAVVLSFCGHENLQAAIGESSYVAINGKVYRDGEPVANCKPLQLNQTVPFFDLPPISQAHEYPAENRGLLFDYLANAMRFDQPKLYRHYLQKLDFADPNNAVAIVNLIGVAAGKQAPVYFDAIFLKLKRFDNPHNYYQQPFGQVLSQGNTKAAMQILEKGISAKGAVDSQRSYLAVAAEKGDLQLVKALLAKGANVDGLELGVDAQARILPLANALENRHFDIVDELLSAGAQVASNKEFDPNRKILTAAIQSGNLQYFDKLHAMGAMPYDDLSYLLHYQFEGKNLGILKRLLALGIKIEERQHKDILEAIRDSLKKGDLNAPEALAIALDNGVRIPAETRKAFYFAKTTLGLVNRKFKYSKAYDPDLDKSHKRMVMLVLEYLQRTDSKSLVELHSNDTLLLAAARNGLPEAVALLVKAGGDKTAKYRGKTALENARKILDELSKETMQDGVARQTLSNEYTAVIELLDK